MIRLGETCCRVRDFKMGVSNYASEFALECISCILQLPRGDSCQTSVLWKQQSQELESFESDYTLGNIICIEFVSCTDIGGVIVIQ